MLNFGTYFVLILAFLVTSHTGSPLQKKDLENILNFLKDQDELDHDKKGLDSSTDTDLDSINSSINGMLKSKDVIDLINKAKRDKNRSKSHNQRETHTSKDNHVFRNDANDRVGSLLEKFLKDKGVGFPTKQKHQRLTPNNLLGPINLQDAEERSENDGLNQYSKIFVILDPLAIRKSENKEALTNLVSRILSLSSATNEKARQERNNVQRYKGFEVKNNFGARRYRRESKEGFSMEEDYKQKRPRNDRGGGGGGAGRTAIPYIRQRGDIYERDH